MRPLRWYGEGHLRPAEYDDMSLLGLVWAVIYTDKQTERRRYGAQRFKSLNCAFNGVGLFEAGWITGFALVEVHSTWRSEYDGYEGGRPRLIFDDYYDKTEWFAMRKETA